MAAEARPHPPAEWLSTLLLALAAVATAWSTYQSAQWRGEQAANTAKSTAARIDSSRASTRAGQLTQVDIATFVQWIDATVDGKPALARFYRERFRTEFQPAVAAWVATHPRTNPDAPKTPFAMPQYTVAQAAESKRLELLAGPMRTGHRRPTTAPTTTCWLSSSSPRRCSSPASRPSCWRRGSETLSSSSAS